jgi:signal transduction histidine kinase
MRRLIDDILKTAREDFKNIEEINLYQLIQEIIENLNPPSNFKIFIQHSLPVVRHHKVSLMQILQNLIGNAIKHMNNEKPIIKVGCLEDEKLYRICVSDNGPGIPSEKQEDIFKLFEKAHGNHTKDSHGIGLSIVKQLVEEFGGEVWVNSLPGEETHFYFTIPK